MHRVFVLVLDLVVPATCRASSTDVGVWIYALLWCVSLPSAGWLEEGLEAVGLFASSGGATTAGTRDL